MSEAAGSASRAEPYYTRDGSLVEELIRPEREGSANLSVARAVLAGGEATRRHRHRIAEEVYYVLSGRGALHVGERRVALAPGQAELIRPGEPHWLHNPGPEPLRILCCCAPPYQHEDTELCPGEPA